MTMNFLKVTVLSFLALFSFYPGTDQPVWHFYDQPINAIEISFYPSTPQEPLGVFQDQEVVEEPKPEVFSKSMKDRIAHARELLGNHYKKSVVKYGEKVFDVNDFVLSRVNAGMKTKSKKLKRDVARAIFKESLKYHFDPVFLLAFIENESSFNPKAVGSAGEIGLMQILPETAKWISKKYKMKWQGSASLKNPAKNIKIGSAYLDFLRGYFDSHSQLYLAAYNMGATNVQRALDHEVWPKEYPVRVMQRYIRMYSELREQARGPAKDS